MALKPCLSSCSLPPKPTFTEVVDLSICSPNYRKQGDLEPRGGAPSHGGRNGGSKIYPIPVPVGEENARGRIAYDRRNTPGTVMRTTGRRGGDTEPTQAPSRAGSYDRRIRTSSGANNGQPQANGDRRRPSFPVGDWGHASLLHLHFDVEGLGLSTLCFDAERWEYSPAGRMLSFRAPCIAYGEGFHSLPRLAVDDNIGHILL